MLQVKALIQNGIRSKQVLQIKALNTQKGISSKEVLQVKALTHIT